MDSPSCAAPARAHQPAPSPAPPWSRAEVEALFALPFNDLLARAHQTHRAHHQANAVQLSTLLSIKTGGCPEDCAYCPQSARYHTAVAEQPLLPLDAVVAAAAAAKAAGATRFCMGAAWRGPRQRDLRAGAGDGARGQGAGRWRPVPRWACSSPARPRH